MITGLNIVSDHIIEYKIQAPDKALLRVTDTLTGKNAEIPATDEIVACVLALALAGDYMPSAARLHKVAGPAMEELRKAAGLEPGDNTLRVIP